ncbi:DUF6301 family protein [Actinoplanes ianthinogenes]|uniref:DUF6301 family protein n=1 Tax=Actinoplanes ianthinogenes TaxID=122358 RepID=UPI001E5678B9|nr:DUF6301 family protein [Actinoplanes ianthinogenes]
MQFERSRAEAALRESEARFRALALDANRSRSRSVFLCVPYGGYEDERRRLVVARWRALGEEAVVRQARTLLAAEPLLHSASVPEAAAAFGWTVTQFDPEWPDMGAFLDTGHGLGPRSAFFNTDDEGRVTSILVSLTESVVDGGAEGAMFKLALFADASSALTGALGRPTRPRAGEKPQLWWERPATWFGLITDDDGISLQLTPAELMLGPWQ